MLGQVTHIDLSYNKISSLTHFRKLYSLQELKVEIYRVCSLFPPWWGGFDFIYVGGKISINIKLRGEGNIKNIRGKGEAIFSSL